MFSTKEIYGDQLYPLLTFYEINPFHGDNSEWSKGKALVIQTFISKQTPKTEHCIG